MLDGGRWREASALIDRACGTTGTHLAIGGAASRENKPVRGDGLSIRVDGANGLQVIWALANATTRGGWTPEQTAMIERLAPHVRQFVRVRQALVGAEAVAASLAGLLDNMMVGVICLDWRGLIVQVNTRAREILREGAGLVERGGSLRAKQTTDDERLSRLLEHALSQPGRCGASDSMTVARSPQRPRLAVHVIPADIRDAGFAFGLVAGLVVVVDPTAKPGIDPESVAAGLGLTPAEGRVAAALAEGATMRDIASATDRAESTVRELAKRIHLKLNISRRADLVRMVLSLAARQSPRREPTYRGS
ncbi:MAG: helix-turn-helix transcriptional regulator [Spirochaetaceae bacterium]|nr:helix-turn-helix transcriptional regulator [Spirochaetaceae bacterium]